MRLNSALVYSFLFVSAVLADSHPEKQQPPFLNHVEKSIDPTTVTPPANKWTGAEWKQASQACFLLITTTDFAAGTFTVPTAIGEVGSGFDIAVGLGDSIGGFVFGVGITAKVVGEEGQVSYEAWCTWLPTRITAPAGFKITIGNAIGAVVQRCSPTSGAVALINFFTGEVWASFVSGNTPLKRVSDTVWVLTTLPNDNPTLPDASLARFLELSLTFLEVHIYEKWGEPDKNEIDTTSQIVQDGRVVAYSAYLQSGVVIFDLQT